MAEHVWKAIAIGRKKPNGEDVLWKYQCKNCPAIQVQDFSRSRGSNPAKNRRIVQGPQEGATCPATGGST